VAELAVEELSGTSGHSPTSSGLTWEKPDSSYPILFFFILCLPTWKRCALWAPFPKPQTPHCISSLFCSWSCRNLMFQTWLIYCGFTPSPLAMVLSLLWIPAVNLDKGCWLAPPLAFVASRIGEERPKALLGEGSDKSFNLWNSLCFLAKCKLQNCRP
jgi:hypothetical protein